MLSKSNIERYLSLCEEAINSWKSNGSVSSGAQNLAETIITIQSILNESLFCTKFFSTLCYSEFEIESATANMDSFMESVRIWVDFIREIKAMMETKPNSLEASFYNLMSYFSISDETCLKNDMVSNFLSQSDPIQKAVLDFYRDNSHLWKSFNPLEGDYSLVIDRISVIKKYENEFLWLFNKLEDHRSKSTLLRILRSWLDFSGMELLHMADPYFGEYRDFDIIETIKDGAIVDCGAFNGDTAINFAESYRGNNKIYCFEAAPENFEDLKNNTAMLDNVVCIQKAVGDVHKIMTIGNDGIAGSLIKGGDIEVDVVPIDDEIKEPIALVKMDIEGAEQSALRGMKGHILNEKPDLIVCSYHGSHDIIEIPLLIDEIRPDYKLYLRYCGTMVVPIDFAIYAV